MATIIDIFVDSINKNRWIKFISTVFAFISPFIPITSIKTNEIISKNIQLTFTTMDIVSIIVAFITSSFLVIIVRIFFYILKKYSEVKESHKEMKDETVIIRALNQITLENLSMQLRGGGQVVTTQQRIEEEKTKLFSKLKIIYPNLPDWKVKEKIDKYLSIPISQETI